MTRQDVFNRVVENLIQPRQDIFNRVVEHLIQQGERSNNGSGSCMYRGPNGLMCAVGCLLKDEHVSPAINKLPVDDSRVKEALRKSGVPDGHAWMLRRLQAIHDACEPHRWAWELAGLAHELELEVPDVLKGLVYTDTPDQLGDEMRSEAEKYGFAKEE